MTGSVLIAEDERAAADYLQTVLVDLGYDVRVTGNGIEALIALEANAYDLVVSDLRMPQMDGFELLSHVKQRWPKLPVIVLTGESEVSGIVEAVQLGATNYLMKPASPAVIESAVQRAMAARPEPTGADASIPELVGQSAAMVEVRHRVVMAARSDVHVMVTGDTGTGKELVSKAIHRHSSQASGPFVAHNCAIAPHDLFESEFFGHRKGSFTGADRDRLGLLREADGGMLFLDELETLQMVHQAKLLRVIDDGEVRPVGDERAYRASVRFVAATNRDPHLMIEADELRADLYYRLRGIEIALPRLCDRPDDIPLLVAHFLGDDGPELTDDAMAALVEAPWPGNVRELLNVVNGAKALCGDGKITRRHLAMDAGVVPRPPRVEPAGAAGAGPVVPRGVPLREVEKQAIKQALEDCGGNRTKAAKLLDIDRSTLRRKIAEYELEG
ncbi:MAG: sigma-54 dependent transcriptional regulator [Actinomycetota bacterium]|nr:sigma-54 dependent transcriptional regulator [Actinomycetota bacterium]